ncbi:MAG: YfhO family protein [Bacteroidetes bacterium]|nr:YfhO family protein [Bacteroidota bacterium]
MKQFNFRKLVPHAVAIGIFLVVTLIFCKPALEPGVMLNQGDVTGWQGMSHQSAEYKAQHGHYPLWATSMFCGMPAYQIFMEGAWSPLSIVNSAFQLWLPKPLNFFFLACISFYFLCICLRIKPYAAIIGAIGFAYASFSPIIITAGHDTQMMALAYAPAVIGAVLLIFDKKYISGFVLTAMLTALQIGAQHQQISYYLFLVLLAMTISYAIRFFRNGEAAHFFKSTGLIAVAGLLGLACNALVLMTSYDYAKESKRGGQLIMDDSQRKHENIKDGKTTGLSKDYAFQWSYGKGETFSLMFPGANGYGLHYSDRDGEPYLFPKLDENSNVAKFFTDKLNVPEDQAINYAMQESRDIYWGDQPFTSGPVYLGAVICFMFLFGMFYLDNKDKWWILAVSVFGILLSWGSNLPGFNYFMFDHLPLYNKFRVPTMTLVIPQLLFPVIAALTLNKLSETNEEQNRKAFKFAGIAAAIAFISVFAFYVSSDFSKENKQRTAKFNQIYALKDSTMYAKMNELNKAERPLTDNQLYEGMISNLKGAPEAERTAREMVTALRKDRAAFLLADIWRSLIFVLITAGFIALYLKKIIKPALLIAGVSLVAAIDLLGFGMKYLNDKSFSSKDRYEQNEFPLTAADEEILKDKDPNYRVFNTSSLEESKTSYYHKSIGGYHPAKLGIYDDLMTYQLNGTPNVSVVNMLNAKYIIQHQGDKTQAIRNPEAMGNAWFVKGVKLVNGPVAEMKALDDFSPADTAIIDQQYASLINGITPADSSATITMSSFDNDAISYKTTSNASHVAIFSEIYYKDWKAYIDGKPAPFFKANYVLRGMVVPAGNHTIEFKFEPAVYFTGDKIGMISSWLVAIMALGFVLYSLVVKPK